MFVFMPEYLKWKERGQRGEGRKRGSQVYL